MALGESSSEEFTLAQSVQRLTFTLDLKMTNLEGKVEHLGEMVDSKVGAIREALNSHIESVTKTTEHTVEMMNAKHAAVEKDNRAVVVELERFEEAALDRQTRVMDKFEALDKRLTLVEGKDVQDRARRFDSAQKWLVGIILGAVAGWLGVNFQTFLTWLSTLPKEVK